MQKSDPSVIPYPFQPIKLELDDMDLLKQSAIIFLQNKVKQLTDQGKELETYFNKQLNISKPANIFNSHRESPMTDNTSVNLNTLLNTPKKLAFQKENVSVSEDDSSLDFLTPLNRKAKINKTIIKKIPKNTLSFLLPALAAHQNSIKDIMQFENGMKLKNKESISDSLTKTPSPKRKLDNIKASTMSIKFDRKYSDFTRRKSKIGSVDTKIKRYPGSFDRNCSKALGARNLNLEFEEMKCHADSTDRKSRLYNDYIVLEVSFTNMKILIFHISKLDVVAMVLC